MSLNMAILKILSLFAFLFVACAFARQKTPRNHVFHPSRVFHKHKEVLKRHVQPDDIHYPVRRVAPRLSEKVEENLSQVWEGKESKKQQVVTRLEESGARPHAEKTSRQSQAEPQPLPSFEEFQSVNVPSSGITYQLTDDCMVRATKVGSLFQLTSQPPNCANLASLLKKVLPEGKVNFESTAFMTLENIIIRSVSFDNGTKEVNIAAAYTGTITLIQDILTVSNIRVALSFFWTKSQKFQFDISAKFSVGDVPIDMRLIRDEQGYFFSADASYNFNATTISRMFKQEDDFLPSSCQTGDLERANFDKFTLINPRLRAAFTEGYGFLFGGSIQILDWDPFDVNILINKPNDQPTTVTVAVYTQVFSISKMLRDLFKIDIATIEVLGNAEIRNLGFSISTGDVETPLTVLDIGSEDIFDIPYRKGLKVSFEIEIARVFVSTSIVISPTLLSLTLSQSGELTLGQVIEEFLPNNEFIDRTDTSSLKLKYWPEFIGVNPLSIALIYFNLEAGKPEGGWALTQMNMKLKFTDPISLFGGRIHINDLELDLNYEKKQPKSLLYGVVLGQIAIGPDETTRSPRVDVRIPFPFTNQEVSFTFTNFTVVSVVEALANDPDLFQTDFEEIFNHLQLDKIAITFDGDEVGTISVDASIPGLWHIFGEFSIANVTIHFEYGPASTGSVNDKFDDNTNGSGDDNGKHNDAAAQQRSSSTWGLLVKGKIIIATCTIEIIADLGNDLVNLTADGSRCSVSVGDILEKFGGNGISLPSLISGFTIFSPKLNLLWKRSGPNAGKSLGFAAKTSLFHQSHVELALIKHGEDKSAVVAAFAIEANALSEISFLSSLGLTDVAVIYVSQRIPLKPYVFLDKTFNRYIHGPDGSQEEPRHAGLTIYAKFEPKPTNMLGKMLGQGLDQDTSHQGASITVEISFPDFYFELVVKLGNNGLSLGKTGGWRFTYMKLIISKRLIGLQLHCSVRLGHESGDSNFTGEVAFTFTGTVTISLLWEGRWNNPLGISKKLTIYRLGLALGINVADLVPSFGITGGIEVQVPSATNAPAISINLTLCIDPTNPDQTVFELEFTRLLLEDVINLFAGEVVKLPAQLAKVGFPDEVQIYFSPRGNDDCFGKSYQGGVEIHGTLQIPFLKIRARVDLSITFQTFRLVADLELDPIVYLGGLIKIVDAYSDDKGAFLHMHITENIADLNINGSCRIEIFGAMISVRLIINSEKLFFEGRLNLWNLFQVYLLVDITLKGSEGTPGVHVIGEMQNDLFAKLKQKASEGIQAGARAISEKLEGAQHKISNAQREVSRLLDNINYHKRKIEDAKNECRRAPWYRKWVCIGTGFKIIYHGAIIAGLYVAYGVAEGVLEVAKLFLKGVEALVKVGAEVLQKLVNAVLSIIDIQYVRFEVTLNGVTKIFTFDARIVILGWTFTPHFSIDFSSSHSANAGIGSAGKSISDSTLKQVQK